MNLCCHGLVETAQQRVTLLLFSHCFQLACLWLSQFFSKIFFFFFLHTVTTSKPSKVVGTHSGSPWGELSQTSCRRRSVCTWLFRTRNTRWQESLSLRQPLALDGGEKRRACRTFFMLRFKVHRLKTSWDGDVLRVRGARLVGKEWRRSRTSKSVTKTAALSCYLVPISPDADS